MEIVKKEILENVHEYKYYGFLCYLFTKSEVIRTLILNNILSFHNLERTELFNEEKSEDHVYDYELKVVEKNGREEVFDLSILPNSLDLVFFLNIRSRYIYTIGKIDLSFHYNFYILCDCDELIFDKFIIKDTDIKKIVGINKSDLSLSEENIMEFHCTISLDCIDDIEISTDLTHFMYLLKYNKPYDEEHYIYKLIESIHNDYLNSEQYALDLEYELKLYRENILEQN